MQGLCIVAFFTICTNVHIEGWDTKRILCSEAIAIEDLEKLDLKSVNVYPVIVHQKSMEQP
jgi:hypothetical protein